MERADGFSSTPEQKKKFKVLSFFHKDSFGVFVSAAKGRKNGHSSPYVEIFEELASSHDEKFNFLQILMKELLLFFFFKSE